VPVRPFGVDSPLLLPGFIPAFRPAQSAALHGHRIFMAVAHPSNTGLFVLCAGDDGVLQFFTHTEAEHEQAINNSCTKKKRL